jgi:signal transduction histidine kinase
MIELTSDPLIDLKHELRTPLAVALLAVAILERAKVSADERAVAGRLRRSLLRLHDRLEAHLTSLTPADTPALDGGRSAARPELIREEPERPTP